MTPDSITNAEGTPEFRISHRAVVALAVVGFVLATMIVVAWVRRGNLPLVDAKTLADAEARWESRAPADYTIEVQVSGRQGATYLVEVRDGEVLRATRNNQPLTQQRTLGTWSVPGMFETIAADVDQLDKVRRGVSDGTSTWLTLRAKFHTEYGYPERYLRLERGQQSASSEVSWSVVRFQVGSDGASQPAAP